MKAFSAANGNCLAVRDSCCSVKCSTTACPSFKCGAAPAANCRTIPARPNTSGCFGCPTYQCPLDCTHVACIAVACIGGKIPRDGFTSCCDKCGGFIGGIGGLLTPCPVVTDCPKPRSPLCKAKPVLSVDDFGCIGCASYDCPPCVMLPCNAPPASANCTETPGVLDVNGCPSCPTYTCPSTVAATTTTVATAASAAATTTTKNSNNGGATTIATTAASCTGKVCAQNGIAW